MLYTDATPEGHKVSIALVVLGAALTDPAAPRGPRVPSDVQGRSIVAPRRVFPVGGVRPLVV
jgi:hypothetical protein